MALTLRTTVPGFFGFSVAATAAQLLVPGDLSCSVVAEVVKDGPYMLWLQCGGCGGVSDGPWLLGLRCGGCGCVGQVPGCLNYSVVAVLVYARVLVDL